MRGKVAKMLRKLARSHPQDTTRDVFYAKLKRYWYNLSHMEKRVVQHGR